MTAPPNQLMVPSSLTNFYMPLANVFILPLTTRGTGKRPFVKIGSSETLPIKSVVASSLSERNLPYPFTSNKVTKERTYLFDISCSWWCHKTPNYLSHHDCHEHVKHHKCCWIDMKGASHMGSGSFFITFQKWEWAIFSLMWWRRKWTWIIKTALVLKSQSKQRPGASCFMML